ncbi:MAG: ATP-binding cassette domain-containing protein [Acidobacteria bacterium]|nr:ATP-binding cassette domain-containing protein [Acidobacteriota bacterium]
MAEFSASPMIEAVGLSKYYGDFAAIRNVSFAVPKGQVAAFLGPNGAGKSTTLKILTGYLSASEGVARIAGHDVLTDKLAATARLGYLPENGPLYPEMTPLELLRFYGEARGLSDGRLKAAVDAVVDQCGLQAVVEKSIHKLSKGYRQRVGMAQVLLHRPDILIMDEPTSGLDPNQIHDVRLLIRQLGRTKTILISTHILQEVGAVADRVILIHEGRLVFDGTPGEMAGGQPLEEAFYRLTRKQSDEAFSRTRDPESGSGGNPGAGGSAESAGSGSASLRRGEPAS